jgi:hypothetical protein
MFSLARIMERDVVYLVCAASALALLIAGLPASAADQPSRNDLRDLRVGMNVAEIPAGEYTDLRCASAPDTRIGAFSDYRRCPADAQGHHGIRFAFDEKTNVLGPLDDKYRGTKVGGHPVLLTLQVGDKSRVVGLDIETDDGTRLFLRKKAYMLGRQAMSYYGNDGWNCTHTPPGADEAPIGRMFLRDHCSKRFDGREIIVHQNFYRPMNAAPKDFVSATKIEIHSIDETGKQK